MREMREVFLSAQQNVMANIIFIFVVTSVDIWQRHCLSNDKPAGLHTTILPTTRNKNLVIAKIVGQLETTNKL